MNRRPIVLLGLLEFIAAGLAALSRLNIEAYPNPAPVILEITAQASGQSAEEMERYFTIPMEVGLSTTPGVDIIRSTSFYGLSFVRVTFRYGCVTLPPALRRWHQRSKRVHHSPAHALRMAGLSGFLT